MENKRVFIGWNGDDNREVAIRVSNLLSKANFSPIVGGEWKKSFTVSEEIFEQMKFCEFGIFLIEKEIRKDNANEILSMGLNPNVMMELGYMLHKVSVPNHTRRILVDMQPNELPSDLQGTWTTVINKDKYSTPEEKEASLTKLAQDVADDFLEYAKKLSVETKKLMYLDKWMENSVYIYNYESEARISEKLIYGLQAAIYSNEFSRLHSKLKEIRTKISHQGNDKQNDYPAVSLACEILNLFVVTNRLTKSLSDSEYVELKTSLNTAYEKNIKDENLRAWCEIFRKDKLGLLNEIYACGDIDNDDKLFYFEDAIDHYHEIIGLIDKQIEKDHDDDYALLFRGFIYRNLSNIHKTLMELDPDNKDEHYELYVQYCKTSLQYRKELFEIYNASKHPDLVSYDFVLQEYILALAEESRFETDPKARREAIHTVKAKLKTWEERNSIRNFIFDAVKKELSTFTK